MFFIYISYKNVATSTTDDVAVNAIRLRGWLDSVDGEVVVA